MASPFENADQTFFALVNAEGQYSLWPSFAAIPAGWTIACGPDSRDACLRHVDQAWTDMRPKSLIAALASAASAT